jgi:hypothetical protein
MGTTETRRVQQPLLDAAWVVLDRHREPVQSDGPFLAGEAWRLRELALAALTPPPSEKRMGPALAR